MAVGDGSNYGEQVCESSCRRRWARWPGTVMLFLLPCALATACTGPARRVDASSSPPPSEVRPIAACGPSVRVQAIQTEVVPRVRSAPTVVLRVGGAMDFATAAGVVVGFTGPDNPSETTVVCRVADERAQPGSTVLVALRPGYVRVAKQVDDRQELVLVKVTT